MEKPKADVDRKQCLACGGCIAVCPRDAITMYASKAGIDKEKCTSCSICIKICPVGAIAGEKIK